MRELKEIKESRNKMRKLISKMNNEIETIKNDREWNELSQNEKKYLNSIFTIKQHYQDQITGINFCLNEDSELNSWSGCSQYQDDKFKNFIFKNCDE